MLKTLADLSLRYRYFLQNLIVRNKYKAENANHLKLLEAFMARDCKKAKKLRYKTLVRGEKVLRRAISQIPSYSHTHRATSKKNPQTPGYYSGSVGYGL